MVSGVQADTLGATMSWPAAAAAQAASVGTLLA